MKIQYVKIDIWIKPKDGGKQFTNETEVEFLLAEIMGLISNKGYLVPKEMSGSNPWLTICK